MPASVAIEIHQLSTHDAFSQVVELQREIWGFDEIELLPKRLFVVASKIGGQLLGAFDAGKMVAFCLCIPGLKAGGRSYLHSQMLGVLPAYRNTGLGRRLKLEQRRYAMELGVNLIEWTFDPFELKNAFFNIERLGAVIRRYVRNQYGTTSSHLHGGLPTDRLVPEWWVNSARVEQLLRNDRLESPATQARIELPADIGEIRSDDPERAQHIQRGLAEQFEEHFRKGLIVTGFERNATTGTYLLSECQLP